MFVHEAKAQKMHRAK